MWSEVQICGQSRTLFGVSWALKLLLFGVGMMRMRRQDWQQGTTSPPSPPPPFMNFCFSHDFLHFLVQFIQKGKRRRAPAEAYCMAFIWPCQGQEGWSAVKPLKPRVAQCTTAWVAHSVQSSLGCGQASAGVPASLYPWPHLASQNY